MYKLLKSALMILGLLPAAHAQLYVITGSYNQAWISRFGSALFEIKSDGSAAKTLDLVPQEKGFFWIGMSYELKRAVVIAPGNPMVVSFLNLERAEMAKTCEITPPPLSTWDQWLADVPGQGATVEILYQGKDLGRDPQELYALREDAAIPCDGGFKPVALQQVKYLIPLGTAGVGDFLMRDGSDARADAVGNIAKWMGTGNEVAFDYKLAGDYLKKAQSMFIYASNSQILVAVLGGIDPKEKQFLVLRKRDGAWRAIPEQMAPLGLKAFGKYVAATEGHTKKAIAAQLKEHPGMVNIDREVMEQELSAGSKEWRTTQSSYGPSLKESFANSEFVFPGRLNVFDSQTGNVYTITTNQGDSEILLIEDGAVYYRVSDRLYSMPISDKGLGEARLVATDEIIRDAHWAFVKH